MLTHEVFRDALLLIAVERPGQTRDQAIDLWCCRWNAACAREARHEAGRIVAALLVGMVVGGVGVWLGG